VPQLESFVPSPFNLTWLDFLCGSAAYVAQAIRIPVRRQRLDGPKAPSAANLKHPQG